MSHFSSKKSSEEYESSGPRPPVPGEESRLPKMIEAPADISRCSPPSFLKWAQTLSYLLEDREGVELFKRYVESERGISEDRLNFYFACEGLKQQSDPEKVKSMIVAIYKFLRKTDIDVPEDLRQAVKSGLKNEIVLSPNIYDKMQNEIECVINNTAYPNFLLSEIYLQHVQMMQSAAMATASASSSSSSCSTHGNIPRSSTLPTLHEDTELSICEEATSMHMMGSHTPSDMPPRLTRDLLLATQNRRLEVRPPGAHGYSVYNAYASYNPVSRQDSGRQSCSSGNRTDSDTVSLPPNLDGRPYVQRKHSSSESRSIHQVLNKESTVQPVIPRTQRMGLNNHKQHEPQDLFNLLCPKLEKVKQEQDSREQLQRKLVSETISPSSSQLRNSAMSSHHLSMGSSSQQHLMLTGVNTKEKMMAESICDRLPIDDDDQAILDQHVSRVWKDKTPHMSPGTASPGPLLNKRKPIHEFNFIGGSGGVGESSSGSQSMRHSKSMPEHCVTSKKLTNKWPSMNTDSGISLVSTDTRNREQSSRLSRPLCDIQLEEARRRLEDETRRSRRYSQQAPSPLQPYSTPMPMPPKKKEYTTVVFSYCDEEFPYRTKIEGTQPTLKDFKDILHKKGNYRYFFKTSCEDPDNPVIQEEIVDDAEILPLFESKVMGLVKAV